MTAPEPASMALAEAKLAALMHQAELAAPSRPWLQAISDLRVATGNPSAANYSTLALALEPYLDRPGCSIGGSIQIFLRLVLCNLAKGILDGTTALSVRLPPSVHELLVEQAQRIVREAADGIGDHYRIDHDFFLKDLALATGRLLPVGSELVQPHSGVPRNILLQNGVRQFLRGALYFLVQRHGFKGYCAFHMDDRNLQDFNPEGWRLTYLRLAELLELNPGISGVFGSAWFYDPVITDISPHLAYLRTVREAGGARNFRGGTATYVTGAAIAKSRRRTSLYRRGEYHPVAWYLVWHRRELLKWAKVQRSAGHGC